MFSVKLLICCVLINLAIVQESNGLALNLGKWLVLGWDTYAACLGSYEPNEATAALFGNQYIKQLSQAIQKFKDDVVNYYLTKARACDPERAFKCLKGELENFKNYIILMSSSLDSKDRDEFLRRLNFIYDSGDFLEFLVMAGVWGEPVDCELSHTRACEWKFRVDKFFDEILAKRSGVIVKTQQKSTISDDQINKGKAHHDGTNKKPRSITL